MTDITTREERMLRLLAGFAYQDWSEYNYAASWYDTDRKPDSWFDDLQRSFELLLRGEPDWGGFWDGEIYDERVVDAMRRALEATWPCDTAQVLKELERAQRPFEIIERMREQGWHVDIVSMNGVNAPTTWKVTFSRGCSHIGCACHKRRSGHSTDLSAAISKAAEEATK